MLDPKYRWLAELWASKANDEVNETPQYMTEHCGVARGVMVAFDLLLGDEPEDEILKRIEKRVTDSIFG